MSMTDMFYEVCQTAITNLLDNATLIGETRVQFLHDLCRQLRVNDIPAEVVDESEKTKYVRTTFFNLSVVYNFAGYAEVILSDYRSDSRYIVRTRKRKPTFPDNERDFPITDGTLDNDAFSLANLFTPEVTDGDSDGILAVALN